MLSSKQAWLGQRLMAPLDYSIIALYLTSMLGLGIYAQYQQHEADDYYVGGRRLGTASIAILWMASWIGGAVVIGSAGRAHQLGITAIWYGLALATGCFLFATLFAAKIKRMGAAGGWVTYPDLIEAKFDARTRVIATITTALAFVAFAAGQLSAAASIVQVMFDWSFGYSLLLTTSVVVIYTALGGFLAITYTDWLQLLLLVLGVVVIGVPIAISHGGTPESLLLQLPTDHFRWGAWGWPGIIALVVSVSLSFVVSMDSFTRCYAAKSEQAARRGPLIAVLLVIIIAGSATWIGLTSAQLFPEASAGDQVLPHFIQALFPVGLKGLILVGLLAAVMSTADICILTVSANVSRDIYQRFIHPEVSNTNLLRISITTSLVVGLLAGMMAWRMQDVIDILLIGFTINGAALVIPTVAAIYWEQTDAKAAFWSIAGGLVTVLIWQVIGSNTALPYFEIDPLWPGLTAATAIFVIGHRGRAPWHRPDRLNTGSN